MWEKELNSRFGRKYIIKWALNPASFLGALSVEERKDDKYIRSQTSQVIHFNKSQANKDSIVTATHDQEDPDLYEGVSKHFHM
jgi:hypothetical protein